ncbi:MAG TPA: class I SAM-dependent methyltransferase [Anaerolineales bacterium]|nr:class I SAM-dependent methyltransferase [Anaerolineales bacterium]
MTSSWRRRFVRSVWATHNDSPAVRAAVSEVLANAGPGARGLNVGAGDTRWGARFVHVDLARAPAVDVVADALALPFAGETFDVVLSQETVEHLVDPFAAAREMGRVLARGGWIYLQAPFIIGYHPGPEDYWRFTRAGMAQLLQRSGAAPVRVDRSVGAGTGFYRILVEFLAGGAARVVPALYLPVKGLASLLCYPLKWLDRLVGRGAQADRIAGGYFAIGRKPS